MPNQPQNTAFPYPLRGLGMIAIFLCVGPLVQTIVASLMYHSWVGGANLLIEISDLLIKDALPRIPGGYSVYMPQTFIAGALCALITVRGDGIKISSAVYRSVIASIGVQAFVELVVWMASGIFNSSFMLMHFAVAFVQAIFSGWVSWIIATGFRLDKTAEENAKLRR